MKNYERFKDELIDLLYRYDLTVSEFMRLVKGREFWIEYLKEDRHDRS